MRRAFHKLKAGDYVRYKLKNFPDRWSEAMVRRYDPSEDRMPASIIFDFLDADGRITPEGTWNMNGRTIPISRFYEFREFAEIERTA
jgi:hypothetical protein